MRQSILGILHEQLGELGEGLVQLARFFEPVGLVVKLFIGRHGVALRLWEFDLGPSGLSIVGDDGTRCQLATLELSRKSKSIGASSPSPGSSPIKGEGDYAPLRGEVGTLSPRHDHSSF